MYTDKRKLQTFTQCSFERIKHLLPEMPQAKLG